MASGISRLFRVAGLSTSSGPGFGLDAAPYYYVALQGDPEVVLLPGNDSKPILRLRGEADAAIPSIATFVPETDAHSTQPHRGRLIAVLRAAAATFEMPSNGWGPAVLCAHRGGWGGGGGGGSQ